MELANKKILVVGAGISGFAAAKLVKKLGADVALSDAKLEKDIKYDLNELREAGIELLLGRQEESQLTGVELVIVSPAVPVRIPLLQAALQRGIEVMSEVELAYRLAQAPLYAVTGTNGKTTTVTLLGLLMETKYGHAHTGVGGNIGVPLCEEVMRVGTEGCTVAEISSYQMEASRLFHPHIAAILNVTPDHVVRHGSLEVYQQMKERIFAQQTKDDYLVLNYDDEHTRSMAQRAKSTVFFFSRQQELTEGACIEDSVLTIHWQGREQKLCRTDELGIKGGHNAENALAAVSVAFLAGAEPAKMVQVLQSFRGVEHRIEPVTTVAGVEYFNDSKATNTDSAIKALETFPDHIVLLAGGDDKMTDLTDFMQLVVERVDELILLGAAAARFKEAALKQGFASAHIHEAGYSMEKAVELAHDLAKPPQVVLLSPACASFDMFDGYEERGRVFKDLVKKL